MDPIITQLLEQAEVSDSLESYNYVPTSELENIPLGSHIKFIDRNENIKSGGFLIKISIKPDRTKSYIILKSNLMYKLYVYYYWIFFKPITHETKITKTIRNYGLDILKDELPKQELIDDPTSTTMNIIIKSKTKTKPKPKVEPKPESKVEPKPESNIESKAETKTRSKSRSKTKSKSSIFKELLESLDKHI